MITDDDDVDDDLPASDDRVRRLRHAAHGLRAQVWRGENYRHNDDNDNNVNDNEVRSYLKRPLAPVAGMVCQYLLMPVMAYLIGLLMMQENVWARYLSILIYEVSCVCVSLSVYPHESFFLRD